jgi:hypothetical protein
MAIHMGFTDLLKTTTNPDFGNIKLSALFLMFRTRDKHLSTRKRCGPCNLEKDGIK